MLFYVIFSVGLLLNRRSGPLAIIAALVLLVAFGLSVMPLNDISEPLTVLQYWSRPVLLLFALGVGLGLLEDRLPRRPVVPRPFRLILATLALWLAISWVLQNPIAEQLRFPAVLLVWLVCLACVFVSVFGASQEGRVAAVAEAFGDAPYSVYLFHAFIVSLLLRLKVEELSPALFVAAVLIGSNLFGLLMYAALEKPILAALRHGLRPRAARPPVSPLAGVEARA